MNGLVVSMNELVVSMNELVVSMNGLVVSMNGLVVSMNELVVSMNELVVSMNGLVVSMNELVVSMNGNFGYCEKEAVGSHQPIDIMMRSNTGDVKSNLQSILQHSILKTEKDLLNELDSMEKLKTGTKIIIYNLARIGNGNLELDFDSDPLDIRNPDTHVKDYSTINRIQAESKPRYKVSLRDYCSILYLKPKMKIVLRGKKERPIPIRFGFTSSKNSDDYGIMMYHKNRLIRAYEKIGYQKQPNELGIGVVGVVDSYFLTPIHNKQDFQRDDKYSAFMTNAAQKLNDYWNEKRGGNEKTAPQNQQTVPDWTWAQCDNCLRWRRLTTGMTSEDLPDKWFCHMNADAQFNRCEIPEEPEDEEEALSGATYKKTFKKQQQERKIKIKFMAAEQNRTREMLLAAKEKELARKEQEMRKKTAVGEVSSTAGSSSVNPNSMTPVQIRRMKKDLDKLMKEKQNKEKEISELKRQKTMSERICREYQKKARHLNLDNLISSVNKQIEEDTRDVTSTSGTIQIKTEEGDIVDIIPVEEPSTSGTNNCNKVVDLTVDSDEEDGPSAPKISRREDIKPDISKIKIEPKQEPSKVVNNTQNQNTQTDKTEDTKTRQRLLNLQVNVHKLLKMIVPDEDLGKPENVEDIVTAMILHNS
ncbi:MORC [Mytilus edulis]|uniref:MORC n=1 Tax=Mytilus edulis TaxID=6550 RepID=A0A8S3UR34_MYTED|nr:MORC [Mytilus edulis]